ncbi:hypothetical protein BSG18_55550 [Pseudomonas ogarae]|nr:hypothetical protein BSG18_55550 [Pseudomonas ogarae]
MTDGVQVHPVRVGDMPHQRLPGGTAIGGLQRQTVGTDDQTAVRVDELQRQERFVWTICDQTLGILYPDQGGIRVGSGGLVSLGSVQFQLCHARTVELQCPVLTTIQGRQHHACVADRPTFLRIHEPYRRQADRNRYPGLMPALPVVIGEQHQAALAHGHQTCAGTRQVDQYAVLRSRYPHGRGIERHAHRSRPGQALARGEGQIQGQQQRARLTDSVHNLPRTNTRIPRADRQACPSLSAQVYRTPRPAMAAGENSEAL